MGDSYEPSGRVPIDSGEGGVRKLRKSIVVLLLLWALPMAVPSLSAQEPGEEWVPMELVRLATEFNFPGISPGLPEIVVGVLPTELAEALELPPGSRIIGGISNHLFSAGFLAVPADASEVDSWLHETLIESGWVPLAPDLPPGGFGEGTGPGLQFCRDEKVSLATYTTPNPDGGSYLRAFHLGVTPWGASCPRPDLAQLEEQVERARSLMPGLRPPPGSTMVHARGGGGTDHWSSQARVIGDVDLEPLADHIEDQLLEGGWTPVEEVLGMGVVVRTYVVMEENGGRWHGTLTVGTPGPGKVRFLEVSLWLLGPPEDGG